MITTTVRLNDGASTAPQERGPIFIAGDWAARSSLSIGRGHGDQGVLSITVSGDLQFVMKGGVVHKGVTPAPVGSRQ